jgi:hypothetical protein
MARIFSHIRVIRFIREIRVKIFALARTLFTHERFSSPYKKTLTFHGQRFFVFDLLHKSADVREHLLRKGVLCAL